MYLQLVIIFELTDYFDYFIIEDEVVGVVAFGAVVVVLALKIKVELESEVEEGLVMKLV